MCACSFCLLKREVHNAVKVALLLAWGGQRSRNQLVRVKKHCQHRLSNGTVLSPESVSI